MTEIHKNRIYATRAECLDFEAEALHAHDFRSATIAAFGAGVALADLVTEELKRMTRAEFGDFCNSTGSTEYLEHRLSFVAANRNKARAVVIEHLKSGRAADLKRRTQRECRATVLQWMREARQC